MKNRIIGVLLAALMLALVLPFAAVPAFADEVGFTVTKNGVPAVAEEDYEWFDDENLLIIYSDGLTVSGKINNGMLFCIAHDLTFENFSITFSKDDDNTVSFYYDSVLYLKGYNYVSNENGSFSGIYSSASSLEIAGDGNLDVYSTHDGIYTEGAYLTVSASGAINVDAEHTAVYVACLDVKETVNMFFMRGTNEDFGAVVCFDYFSKPESLALKGSAKIVDSVGSLTADAWFFPWDDALEDEYGDYMSHFYVGKNGDCTAPFAQSLAIPNSDYVVRSLGAKINENTSSLRLGARYNGFLLGAAVRASVEDLGMLFYPSHLLGENTLDLKSVSAVRMSATAIEEFDSAKKFVDYDSFTFYVTIVNIPDKGKDTDISFRPYIIYSAGTFYGDVLARSYNDVVNVNRGLALELGDNEIICPYDWFDD
ncbi:MAG: hypothetical protein KBS44_08140 [Clostridiales bacterium]|nr:hypothetical protein [Candidatus Coliplasma equi]